jgi:hypothetical protein
MSSGDQQLVEEREEVGVLGPRTLGREAFAEAPEVVPDHPMSGSEGGQLGIPHAPVGDGGVGEDER